MSSDFPQSASNPSKSELSQSSRAQSPASFLRPSLPPGIRIRPVARRLEGIELKVSESLTLSLLSDATVHPYYTLLPRAPRVYAKPFEFLEGSGFSCVPPPIDPCWQGPRRKGVLERRGARKRAQLANILLAFCALVEYIPRKATVADLCGGCGHVGLLLAAIFPNYKVIIVDSNRSALRIASERGSAAGLNNVDVLEMDLADENAMEKLPQFHATTALHACAGASDIAILAALQRRAAMVVSPCCTGGLVSERCSVAGSGRGNVHGLDFNVARSKAMRTALKKQDENIRESYSALARAGDYAGSARDAEEMTWRRASKALLEQDRLEWIRENSYEARLAKLYPLECTPKNDVIVAWPLRMGVADKNLWVADTSANEALRNTIGVSVNAHCAETPKLARTLDRYVGKSSSQGFVHFPVSLRARERKAVHSLAHTAGFWHESVGRGGKRHVTVRRNREWPLVGGRYVCVMGMQIQELAERARKMSIVPEEFWERRKVVREEEVHCTVVSPKEMSVAKAHATDGNVLDIMWEFTRNTDVIVKGIGMTEKNTQGEGLVKAYYFVVSWEEAQAARKALGLPKADLHITLGFSPVDVHGVDKGVETIVHHLNETIRPWDGMLVPPRRDVAEIMERLGRNRAKDSEILMQGKDLDAKSQQEALGT